MLKLRHHISTSYSFPPTISVRVIHSIVEPTAIALSSYIFEDYKLHSDTLGRRLIDEAVAFRCCIAEDRGILKKKNRAALTRSFTFDNA